jgi:PTB domain (IRS-1 type)
VVRKWPINELKRWAAAPEKEVLFLDFGDHPDGYVALSTNKSTTMAKKIKECINSIVEGLQQKKEATPAETTTTTTDTHTDTHTDPVADASASSSSSESASKQEAEPTDQEAVQDTTTTSP